ncbi:MAG TPA: sortase [Actinomycetota bacterium]|nr:sortase [Actinomycetota bacterium]
MLCLFGALGVAAYIGWIQWGTGFLTARSQDRLRTEIDQRIADARAGRPAASERISLPGDAVAIIRIPTIHLDMVVVEGVSTADLQKGPGHYPKTAYPWQPTGRVGIAGHRTTYLHPFWNLDHVRPGDRISLVTEYGTFDYDVTGSRVVLPTDVGVLRQTEAPTLVLTACTPRFSASRRLVVFARRTAGSAEGPQVRVVGAGAVAGVGPGDDIVRSLVITLVVSFGVGGGYLALKAARRRRAR